MNSIADLLSPQEAESACGRPGGFVLGVVSENADASYPGSVRVEFTGWEDGKNISRWLPVLSPYAGKDYGRYLVPEVGDVVLVGFAGPRMETPFVLGSFFPAGATLPGDSFDSENRRRSFTTKGGISLTLSDEAGKECLTASTPGGLTLKLDDGAKTLSLSDKDGNNAVTVDCQGGALTLKAGTSLSIEVGSCKIGLDGNAGKVSISGGQLELSGTQSAKLSSNANTTVEGSILKLDGKQTTLSGTAIAEVKGGILKLN